jgi:hypothetical protein
MIAVAIITAIINELPVDRLRALPVAAVISAPEQEQASAPAPAPDEAPQRKRRRGRKVARANKGGRPRSKPIETTTSAMTNGHDPDDGWKESVRAVHGISNRAAAAN